MKNIYAWLIIILVLILAFVFYKQAHAPATDDTSGQDNYEFDGEAEV